jgi:hypothetical protein
VPRNPGRLGTSIYIVTLEISRPVEARHTSCTQLVCKPRDPSRQGTAVYVVTSETSRCGQARHTHLRSSRGNLKNTSVYYNLVGVPSGSVKTRIICIYAVLVAGDPLRN